MPDKSDHIPKIIYFGKKESIIQTDSTSNIININECTRPKLKDFDLDSVSRSSNYTDREGTRVFKSHK